MINMVTLHDIPNNAVNSELTAIAIPSADDDQVVRLSYHETRKLIESAATAFLSDIGLGLGDVVSIVMSNTIPYVLSFLGVAWCSATAAPLNPNYTKTEYKFYMKDASAKLLLLPTENVNDAAEDAAKELGIAVYYVGWDADDMAKVIIRHKLGPAQLRSPSDEVNFAVNPLDVALFLHTSGTTARPKGVPLTHNNLLASISNIVSTYSLSITDATLLIMPLFHVHGLMAALLSTLASGGCVVMPPEGRFAASTFWRYVQTCHVTWYTGVPTMHQILLSRCHKDYPAANPPQLRFIRSCSSSLAPAILEQIESKFHAPCLEAYAMTEAAHQMCSNPYGKRKAGTVGQGMGVEVVIMETDGETVAKKPGTIGEVCIRGDNVTSGYSNVTDEVNVESFKGGYFHTGDQGYLDEEGFLTLTGRIKELINRGGEKISPLEVDAAMLNYHAVSEAVSFSMSDEKYGEVVAAAIVLKDNMSFSEDDFKAFLSDHLSTFKIPVKVFVGTELPKTATGKIQRRIVASHFLAKKDLL